MSAPRIEDLQVPRLRRHGHKGTRAWREWCFLRMALRHFRLRLLLMSVILLGGAALFVYCEPERKHSLPRAMFYTWALVFGEPPEEFPRSIVLQTAFFIMPILGLTVIIEGIIDFALMMRDRKRYERSWCNMLANSYTDHIVLVGFGRLGYRTFLVLRKMGEAVVVIERDDHNEFLEELRRDGSPLLIGDARREALLDDANIGSARSIVLATDDDMANLEVALDARRVNPSIRVVLRMFDQNVADKVGDGFEIHNAMSQSQISAPMFATAAVVPSIVNSFVVDNRLVVMQRWLVRQDGPLCGKSIQQVIEEMKVVVVEHRPGEGEPRLFPPPTVQLRAGDGLIVQGPFEVVAELGEQVRQLH
ncbi:MAG: potassium channel family protein [Planctomycetota bacterium]|jgi:Trk K+ transport system NAD-binding subunit